MIVGDANMSEVATYLKVGTTAIVLAMIEDDELGDDWLLGNPVGAIRQVSHDPSLTRTVMLRDGRRATAMEVQWGLLERARKYERLHGLSASARRSAPTSSTGGSACSPGSSTTPTRSPTGSTGWPSGGSSRATPIVTGSSRPTPS